jgi:UDP-3-O-[3-hydroxymyristoyl] N-acetylglucosamine deacetylase
VGTEEIEVSVDGMGLHTGAASRVTLRSRPGPVTLGGGGLTARIEQLSVASTVRATTVEACGGALRVGTVEHAFAALAGLGVYTGLALDVDGPEMPLLDGCAVAWCDAIARLRPAAGAPRLRVAREATVTVGRSRYELAPRDRVEVEVRIECDDARVTREARWEGGADDFRQRIAPARTFVLARDVEELAALGLARSVDPASVVVLAPDAVHHAGRPFSPDEPARHKLLDLIGDLYLHGGPPFGRVRAVRPGHASNAMALAQALADRIVIRA